MEGRRHHTSLSHQDRIVTPLGKNFDTVANALDARCADEDHLQRSVAESADGFENGGINLPSVGVAADCDVERVQARLMRILYLLRQQNRASASSERGLAMDEFIQLL